MFENQNHHRHPADAVDKSLEELRRQKPSPEFIQSLHSRMLHRHAVAWPRRRLWPWAVPISAGSAIAAMLLIAFMLWPRPAATFGAVQSRMRGVSTMSCVAHLVLEDKRVPPDILTISTWADAQKGARTEARVLGIPIMSSLVHWGQEGWLINHLRAKTVAVPPNQIALSRLRELDPTRLVLDLREQEGIRATPLDEQTIDGQRARGFRLSDGFLARRPGTTVTMWVSTSSQLPVRLECRLPVADRGYVDFVVDQFQWDVPLASSLFESPANVNTTSVTDVISRPNQAILLAGLRGLGQRSGGYYPGSPQGDQALIMLVLKLRSASEQGGSWAEREQEDTALFEKLVNGGIFLLMQASHGRMPAYDGFTVNAAVSDRELISWNNEDGTRQRFAGNLSSMPGTALPLKPGAQPALDKN